MDENQEMSSQMVLQLNEIHHSTMFFPCLSTCSHKEADSRMLLHVSHAALHGYEKILICSVDSGASCSVLQSLREGYEVGLAFVAGKNVRHFAVNSVLKGLGSEKACAHPMIQTLCGCATENKRFVMLLYDRTSIAPV